VLLGEPDRSAILHELERFEEKASSRLLALELRRLASRTQLRDAAEQLLAGVALIPITDPILGAADTLGPTSVATLDAIHLATALSLVADRALDALMTYDPQLAAGARHHGIPVIAP